MEFKTDALVLRAADYGENDKIVTLFTADRGKLSVGMKGVKRAGAKLKFAAQPFCFAEYVIFARGGRNTVTGAFLHDGFYGLREDLGAYYAGTALLEVCDALLFEGIVNGELFVSAVSTLGRLAEGAGGGTLLRFLLDALRLAGYPVAADVCGRCGKPLTGKLAFDFETGSFLCREHMAEEDVPASTSTLLAIQAAMRGEEGQTDGIIRALRLLRIYFRRKTDADLSSLGEFLSPVVYAVGKPSE